MGVKLVSAKEDFGEGIMADAMEAVTDIMNEVQVRLSGQDIAVKMANKARNGGTISKAKLGYENSRVEVDGRKVNTITVDNERVRYVIMAFELMASGNYHNVEDVQAALTDAGLRMPKTGKPVSKQIAFRMLRDRDYLGFVKYKGIKYKGRHQPLISEELFNRVQRILDSHSGSGVRRRVHHHYLKGLLWCDRCRTRFILQRAKGRLGGEYFYFLLSRPTKAHLRPSFRASRSYRRLFKTPSGGPSECFDIGLITTRHAS